MFPEKLAEDQISSWSNEGDLVFDPFSGSGTTAKMAYLNNRHYIACDISSEYVAIANERMSQCKS
jgi:site-specific DNA-methyltransferase (adenine-specific)